jgi:hypothetical protein
MAEISLSRNNHVNTKIIAQLIVQVKCKYCKFSDKKIMHCNRTARYQDDNNKLRCSMYLYRG